MHTQELRQLDACWKEPLNGSNLRTTFLLLTRAHFSDPKNYGYLEKKLSCFVYDTDAAASTLSVELSQEYDVNKASKRPAVFVGLDQAFQFAKVSNDMKHSNFEDNSGESRGFIVNTALSIIHVAETIDQALLLADSSASFYIGITDAIKGQLELMSFMPATISPPALIEKGQERGFRVDVTFSLSFNYVVNANIESHRLKKFAIELAAEES